MLKKNSLNVTNSPQIIELLVVKRTSSLIKCGMMWKCFHLKKAIVKNYEWVLSVFWLIYYAKLYARIQWDCVCVFVCLYSVLYICHRIFVSLSKCKKKHKYMSCLVPVGVSDKYNYKAIAFAVKCRERLEYTSIFI